MDALEAIQTRRSTRRFAQKPVEDALLDTVLQCGRLAPSGGNNQSTHFLVITSPEVRDTLAKLVSQQFAAMEESPNLYRSLLHSIRASKTGNYVFHFNAPVLIVTANRIGYGNAMADCACALENMMVAASALDLGACWINQLRWLNEDPVLLEYLRSLGLKEDERVFGALALGWPLEGSPLRTPLPRTGNPVTYIR